MDNLEKQIQQFWEHQTSPEQRREILRQLEGSGMEWKEFLQQYYKKVLEGEEASGLGDEQKSRVWQRLKDQHLKNEDSGAKVIGLSRRTALLPWMAAACVLLIVGLWVYRWERKPSGNSSIVEQPMALKMIIKKNTGTGEESLVLPDRSTVLLASGSIIRYQENFEARARNIQLEGRALFDVAKDSARPFTVTARGFATTALGTRFIVDASRSRVSIRLLKGKIVINTTVDAGMAMQNVYLTPGQELLVNTETKHFDLNRSYEDSFKQSLARVSNRKKRQGKTGEESNAAELSFEKTSLATVFQRLSEYYKTSILYDKAEVQGLSFTGAFEPSDELDLALKVICNMNQLSYTKENDRIVISKQQ